MRFNLLLLTWLNKYVFPLEELETTKDNGAELIGTEHKKPEPSFSLLVTRFTSRHTTIPEGRPDWDGSLDKFHTTTEPEFYDLERIKNVLKIGNTF